jgi:hypothetical protein
MLQSVGCDAMNQPLCLMMAKINNSYNDILSKGTLHTGYSYGLFALVPS